MPVYIYIHTCARARDVSEERESGTLVLPIDRVQFITDKTRLAQPCHLSNRARVE